MSQKKGEFVFPFADGTAKLSGKDCEFRESTPRRKPTVRSEDFIVIRECLNRQNPHIRMKARGHFWSIQGDLSVVITMN